HVAEREEGIDGIGRRPTLAAGKGPAVREQARERSEVAGRGGAFDAAERFERCRGLEAVRRRFQLVDRLAVDPVGVPLAMPSEHRGGVLDLPAHDFAGYFQAERVVT